MNSIDLLVGVVIDVVVFGALDVAIMDNIKFFIVSLPYPLPVDIKLREKCSQSWHREKKCLVISHMSTNFFKKRHDTSVSFNLIGFHCNLENSIYKIILY